MALYQKSTSAKGSRIGIWKIEESIADLLVALPHLSEEVSELTNERRRKEWLCVRLLLQNMMAVPCTIQYNQFHKPYLWIPSKAAHHEISISHSQQYVALIVHPHYPLGIDIELVHSRVLKIRHKYLSNREQQMFAANDTSAHTLFWCAKEAMYKLYGKKELYFIEDLMIEEWIPDPDDLTNKGQLICKINKNNKTWHLTAYYQYFNGQILVYVEDVL